MDRISNLINNQGRAVANQFIRIADNGIIFQSYKSNIAYIRNDGILEIGKDWDYSQATSKYLKQFINEHTNFIYKDRKSFEKEIKENNKIIYNENL